MNATILRVSIRNLVTTTLWYTLGVVLMGLLMVFVYPSFQDSSIDLNQMIESYPPALLDAMGISADDDFTNYATFMGLEYLNLMWPIIVAVFLIMAGTSVIASEIEHGTAELWLSIPARRNQLLTPKLVSLLAASLIIVLATIFVVGFGAAAFDDNGSTSASGVLSMGVVLVAFTFCVGGYSVLLSSLFNSRGRAAGIAAAVTMIAYLLSVISSLTNSLEWVKYLTFWTAFKPQNALANRTVSVVEVGVLFSIGIASIAAAYIVFARRDIVL